MDRYIVCIEATIQILWNFRVPVALVLALLAAPVIRDARRMVQRRKFMAARGAR